MRKLTYLNESLKGRMRHVAMDETWSSHLNCAPHTWLIVPNEFVKPQPPSKLQGVSSEKPLVYEVNESNYELFHAVLPASTNQYIHRDTSSTYVNTDYLMGHAYDQSILKFGERLLQKYQHHLNKRFCRV